MGTALRQDTGQRGPGNAELVKRGGIAFTLAIEAAETLGEFFTRTAPAVGDSLQESLLVASDVDIPEKELLNPSMAVVVAEPEMETGTSFQVPQETKLAELNVSETRLPFVATGQEVSSMDLYGDFLVKLTQVLAKGPKSENDVAMLLGLEKAQAKVWLRRAAESGSVGKLKKPVRYGLPKQQYLL